MKTRGKRRHETLPPRLELPSAPKRTRAKRRITHPGLVALLVAQLVFLALGTWGLTSTRWQVRQVQIAGTNDATLIAAIRALPLTGCNVFRCDTEARAKMIAALPLVAQAEVHAAYPDGLVVIVTPRRPGMVWHAGGATVVLADDGTVLGTPESDPTLHASALPQVVDDNADAFDGHAPVAGARLDAATVKMAGQLLNGLSGALSGGWHLTYSGDPGFVATNGAGTRVVFGTPDDATLSASSGFDPVRLGAAPDVETVARGVATQLAAVHSLLDWLHAQGQRATVIDVRWGAHPYYRLGG
jgi:hypothetical protein